jgi:hypothetical protein
MSKPQKERRLFLLERTLFLDILRDPKARSIFIYVALLITVSAAVFHWLEGWRWLDSFDFVDLIFTTDGFGGIVPTLPNTKINKIFVGLNGVAILLLLSDENRRVRTWVRVENR